MINIDESECTAYHFLPEVVDILVLDSLVRAVRIHLRQIGHHSITLPMNRRLNVLQCADL